jgi:amino acid transporter
VLGAFDLVLLGIGGIIGAGVFVLTGARARASSAARAAQRCTSHTAQP